MDRRGLAGTLDGGEGGVSRGLLSAAYAAACALDRARYRAGLARVWRLPRPVISVGNLAVGGGGKTPLVLWLGRALEDLGLSVAVLSRGYGRKGKRPARVVLSGDPVKDSAFFGDEPLLMAGAFSRGRVYVGQDRHRAGLLALREGAVDVFLLDDGFQHRALARDLDIVAVDDRRRFGNGRLLPAGILREPLWRLTDADAVVVTKSAGVDPGFEAELKRIAGKPVFWAGLRLAGIQSIPGRDPIDPSALAGAPLVAFSGIADPGSFDATLRDAGLSVAGTVHFPDHHPYAPADAADLEAMAAELGAAALVTTEKDAARWPGRTSAPCYAVRMEHAFHEGEEEFLRMATGSVRGAGERRG